MKYTQDFHRVIPHAVGNNVRSAKYNEFPGSRDASRPPQSGVIGQMSDGFLDGADYPRRSRWILFGNIRCLLSKVCQC